jgi:2-(1,2-epoxy-1,2-dihydrophenyl)acetyl-CoA isomerase
MTYADLIALAREEDRELVHVDVDDGRALVRMDEPGRLNALSAAMAVQLNDALSAVAADPEVRSIVLTGTDPGFCAGGDLKLMRDVAHPGAVDEDEGTYAMWRFIRGQFGGVVRTIARTDKPVIAAVNGAAAGVGLAFALASDLLLVSDRARLVLAFGRIGLVPEVGTSWLLARRLGHHRAFAVFAAGEPLGAQEAYDLGIGTEVVAHDELLARADAWCDRLDAVPAPALAMTKPLLRQAADLTWEQALAMEEYAEPNLFTTAGHRRAVNALLSGGASGASSRTGAPA